MRPPVKKRLNTTSALMSFMPRYVRLADAVGHAGRDEHESAVASTVFETEIHMLLVKLLVLKIAL